ncbi:MAG: PAS domain S-box protein, partial [Acidimicrobiales bacterium]
MSWSEPRTEAGFASRLRARLLDPINIVIPPLIAAFCLARPVHLVADLPYWAIAALVLVTLAVNAMGGALWGDAVSGGRLVTRVGVEMGTIALVIYGIGWGPVLVIGFVYGAADTMRTAGSAAARPAMIWTLVCVALGQLAIFTGLAPTLVHEPRVDALGAMGAVGAVLTIKLLEWFAVARETSEGRFRALVQHASDIIVVTDHDGKMSYVSPAFGRILGITSGQFGRRQANELLHPDDLTRLRATAADLDEGWRTEIRLQDSEGSWHWFEATVTDRLDDPNVRGMVANLHDISERKAAEDALRAAHERFRSAFENAPIGMAMIDLKGRIIRGNPALGTIVGRQPTELAGTSIVELTHGDDRQSSLAEIRHLIATGSEGYQIEKRYLHADGHGVWVSVSVSCVRDDDDDPLYLIAQVEDVTERRALRERLAYAAIHDPLTGLPNRELFMDRLEITLRRA